MTKLAKAAEGERGPFLAAPSVFRFIRSRTVAQAAGFAGSNLLTGLLGAVAMALLARSMPTQLFGSYSFAVSFLIFSALFFEFGLFLPGARRAALVKVEEQRQIVGSSLLLFFPVALGFGLLVFALSYWVDAWFNVSSGPALRMVAPLAFVFPFQLIASQLAQGLDRLHVYSVTSAIGEVLFVGTLALAAAAGSIGISAALLIQAGAALAGWAVFTAWLRPSFRDVGRHVQLFWKEAGRYGFSVYVGRVLSTGTYNMDVLMVAAVAGARDAGFYALARAITYPIGLPAVAMAHALFPRMMKQLRLDRAWLLGAWALGLAGAVLAWLFARPFIRIVFSARYLPTAHLVVPLALASTVAGVTRVYNSYLSARARGRDLRNAAFILTGSNALLNFALIPPFGAMGAAWASLVALLANLASHAIFYRRSLRTLAPELDTA